MWDDTNIEPMAASIVLLPKQLSVKHFVSGQHPLFKAMAAKHSVPMVPMTTLPLEGAGMEALCDALLRRLLPALEPLVEEAANRAAMLAVRMIWGVFLSKHVVGWLGKYNLLGLDLLMKERTYYFFFRCHDVQVLYICIEWKSFFSPCCLISAVLGWRVPMQRYPTYNSLQMRIEWL